MASTRTSLAFLSVALLVTACATTTVSNRQSEMGDVRLPRPGNIYVYPFAVTSDDLPPDSGFPGTDVARSTPLTPAEIQAGDQLGEAVARNLAEQISAMGLPAQVAGDASRPQPGDLIFRGAFLSIDEGSRTKRLLLGFGAGNASLDTYVVGYQMTPDGPRRLGSGQVASGASKLPGMWLPAAVTIVTANPIGLVVGGVVKAGGELSGSNTIEGSGKRTASKIAEVLKGRFEQQGWID